MTPEAKWALYDGAVRLLHQMEIGRIAVCDQSDPGDETRWSQADAEHDDAVALLKAVVTMMREELQSRPMPMLHPPGMRSGGT